MARATALKVKSEPPTSKGDQKSEHAVRPNARPIQDGSSRNSKRPSREPSKAVAQAEKSRYTALYAAATQLTGKGPSDEPEDLLEDLMVQAREAPPTALLPGPGKPALASCGHSRQPSRSETQSSTSESDSVAVRSCLPTASATAEHPLAEDKMPSLAERQSQMPVATLSSIADAPPALTTAFDSVKLSKKRINKANEPEEQGVIIFEEGMADRNQRRMGDLDDVMHALDDAIEQLATPDEDRDSNHESVGQTRDSGESGVSGSLESPVPQMGAVTARSFQTQCANRVESQKASLHLENSLNADLLAAKLQTIALAQTTVDPDELQAKLEVLGAIT